MVRTNCTALLNVKGVGDHSPNWAGSPRPVDHGRLSGTAGPARVSLELSGSGQSAYEVHDEDVTDAAVDYLDRFGESRRPVKPSASPSA